MKKGTIIYQSKYGATKKYAEWLKEMTEFDCIETKKAAAEEMEQYDTVILCGGIYASGIAGISFLRENFSRLKDKKTAIFCVGASPYDENGLEKIKEHNLTGDLKEIPLFYGRGAWDESKMKFLDRTLCKMLQKFVVKKNPEACEPWMRDLITAAGQTCDWTDKKYLDPLVEYLHGIR
ncbi:flavodoxin domain-containing protein [Cuneatibacter caecimuris]|uniref:Menaquinone-dependent protoporphyrinogen IX oxidase n=1 Tax=Cuneatibacter caecimuris TaxID=1796618 RepID=A0A4Q7PK10_9FIRM|nr:flavodoxin domain-containing protein [Cuneatibacter caecimuris]RZT01034.1 menaquinone-dependent protoporphyrinogen IX oxidase [Cuneatibacter caecimuris]